MKNKVLSLIATTLLLVGLAFNPVNGQDIRRGAATALRLANNVYFTGANSSGVQTNMFRMAASDVIEWGAPMASATFGITAPSVTATTGVSANNTGYFYFTTRSGLRSTANGLMQVKNNAENNAGYEINMGTAAPSVTTCGTGAIATHSSNMAGSFSTTGATTCTLTFGAPAWTFTPFCTFTEKTTAGPYRISAESTTAITITGFTSGDSFTYTCGGGAI